LPGRAHLRRSAPIPSGTRAPAARDRRRRGPRGGADRAGDGRARSRQPRRRQECPRRSAELADCKVRRAAAFYGHQEVAMPVITRRCSLRTALLCLPAAVAGVLAVAGVACSYRGRYAPNQPRYAMARGGDAPTERPAPELNTEAYDRIYDNPFLAARDNPLS